MTDDGPPMSSPPPRLTEENIVRLWLAEFAPMMPEPIREAWVQDLLHRLLPTVRALTEPDRQESIADEDRHAAFVRAQRPEATDVAIRDAVARDVALGRIPAPDRQESIRGGYGASTDD